MQNHSGGGSCFRAKPNRSGRQSKNNGSQSAFLGSQPIESRFLLKDVLGEKGLSGYWRGRQRRWQSCAAKQNLRQEHDKSAASLTRSEGHGDRNPSVRSF
jgi:hypothetical protein